MESSQSRKQWIIFRKYLNKNINKIDESTYYRSSRDAPGHLTLKSRVDGQGSINDLIGRNLKEGILIIIKNYINRIRKKRIRTQKKIN